MRKDILVSNQHENTNNYESHVEFNECGSKSIKGPDKLGQCTTTYNTYHITMFLRSR